VKEEGGGFGCVFTLIALNILAMGLVALSFAQGPYSSAAQEYWYRYTSVGFLLFGAILPAIVFKFYGRRSAFANQAVFVWGLIALLTFVSYVFSSGGGV
jgi:hypothetical protein